jgi:hypothetical protein
MDFTEIKQLAKQEQQEVFRGMTSDFQMKVHREFQAFHMPFVDQFYADTLKCAVSRDTRYKNHATLSYGGRSLGVMEKYKTSDFPELQLEILKDLIFPPEQALGMFFDKRFNRLINIVCVSPDGMFAAPHPNKIYVVNLDKMRGGLSNLLQAGGRSSIMLGTKFKKATLSLNIEWELLISNDMATVYNL